MAGEAEYGKGIGQSLFSIGYRCWVRVADDASGSGAKKIGFIDSMSATKQIQTQRAQVCGAILAASIDPQAISFNVSISGYLATPDVYKNGGGFNGYGEKSIEGFNPDTDDFTNPNKGVMPKFAYIDFYDEKKGIILCKLKNAIVTNFQLNVQGGAYAKASVNLEALDMSSGTEYLDQVEKKDTN